MNRREFGVEIRSMSRFRTTVVGLVITALVATSCTQSEVNTDPLRGWEGDVVERGVGPAPIPDAVASEDSPAVPDNPLAFGDSNGSADEEPAASVTTIAANDRLNPEFVFDIDLGEYEPTSRRSLTRFSTQSIEDLRCPGVATNEAFEREPIFEAVFEVKSHNSEVIIVALTFDNIETVGLLQEAVEGLVSCEGLDTTRIARQTEVAGYGPATLYEVQADGITFATFAVLEHGSIEVVVSEVSFNNLSTPESKARLETLLASTAAELFQAQPI